MSRSKVAVILGAAVTLATVAPAFAHKEGWEWLNMMDRLRQQRLTMEPAARAQVIVPVRPDRHQYRGGPKTTIPHGS